MVNREAFSKLRFVLATSLAGIVVAFTCCLLLLFPIGTTVSSSTSIRSISVKNVPFWMLLERLLQAFLCFLARLWVLKWASAFSYPQLCQATPGTCFACIYFARHNRKSVSTIPADHRKMCFFTRFRAMDDSIFVYPFYLELLSTPLTCFYHAAFHTLVMTLFGTKASVQMASSDHKKRTTVVACYCGNRLKSTNLVITLPRTIHLFCVVWVEEFAASWTSKIQTFSRCSHITQPRLDDFFLLPFLKNGLKSARIGG